MIPGLNESSLSQYASPASIRRGREYLRGGAVLSAVRRGHEVEALVKGTSLEPYRVRIAWDESGLKDASCTCPYSGSDWCKHVVVGLLTCIHDGESIEERPRLDELLETMTREQLVELIRDAASEDPLLHERLEQRVTGAESASRQTPADRMAIQRRVKDILHSLDRMRPSDAYWHVGGVVNQINEEIERALKFVHSGDGRNALLYLEAITDVYVEGWTRLDDSDGMLGELFDELGTTFAEAILSADLAPDERRRWSTTLEKWQGELDDYGVEGAMMPAIVAAENGWDDPELQAILAGNEEVDVLPHPLDGDPLDDGLIEIRLGILERRGQFDAYLRLAGALGYLERYLVMLVRIGLVELAVEEGLLLMENTGQAFALARRLREKNALEEALRIGEHGLTLGGGRLDDLATWVSELALELGETSRALRAALFAAQFRLTLERYLRVQDLAGIDWPGYREELIEKVRSGGVFTDDAVDIYLHEGLVTEAVAVADRHPHDYRLARRIVEPAKEVCPAWVVRIAKYHAEQIISSGRSAHYHHAVEWLAHAREANIRLGAEDAWRAYAASLKHHHGRKRKLMELMRELL